ncbi:hypothetical protein KR018_008889, partial [Drosophila ironensis]
INLERLQARHPFDFFDETIEDFVECLSLNNITELEYEHFERFGNLQNVLNENVDLKFKCNIRCQLERQPTKWLNAQGKMDLNLMNATSEAAESIGKCMENASEEPCAYAFKLVVCASQANHPVITFEDVDPADSAAVWEEVAVDGDDAIDYETATA